MDALVGAKRALRDEDLDSEFDYAPEKRKKTWRDDPLATERAPDFVHVPTHSASVPTKEVVVVERDREEWRARKYHYLAMDAYSRHKALVNQYLLSCGKGIEHVKRSEEKDRNDFTVLAEEHRFLWNSDDVASTWEKRLAKTYYDKLFKEYAIADLSRYKENRIAMRWRIKKEVCDGKGQFVCGNKHCARAEELVSWEVNFAYVEQGEQRNALVKLRLCPKCSKKLNYHKKCKVWGRLRKAGGAGEADNKGRKGGREKKAKKHKKKAKKDDVRRHHRHRHRSSERDISTDESDREESSDDDKNDDGKASDSKVGGEGSSQDGGDHGDETSEPKGSEVWKKPAEAFLERSQKEEFDDYFKDMLL